MNTILIETQKAFAAWRSQGNQQYNTALKSQAVSCLAYYGYKQVGDALSLTDKTIRNWEKALTTSNPAKPGDQEPEFVPISLSHSVSTTTQSVSVLSTLQLTLPSGLMMNVPHQNIKETVEFIIELNKELCSCSI